LRQYLFRPSFPPLSLLFPFLILRIKLILDSNFSSTYSLNGQLNFKLCLEIIFQVPCIN
jgi:hypothetical protein